MLGVRSKALQQSSQLTRQACFVAMLSANWLWLVAALVLVCPIGSARVAHPAAGATTTASRLLASGNGQVRPRVFIYTIPEPLATVAGVKIQENSAFRIMPRLRESPYYEPDPSKADYFWIPIDGRPINRSAPPMVIEYVRSNFPYFNMTVARGEARHIMLTELDNGPNENFGWPQVRIPEYSPASLTRHMIYLAYNGANDQTINGVPNVGCAVCFQRGKDIMLPTKEAVCGPLCGYTRDTLKAKSMWMRPPEKLEGEFTRQRSHLLFFAGNMHADQAISQPADWDFTGRGGLYKLYKNHSRYHLGHRGHQQGRTVAFADAMSDAEFCYSPLGTSGGDTDRYVAAALFGCIPVLLNTSHSRSYVPHALPFEEVLPWHEFGTIADNYNLASLDQQLRCLLPRVPQMRRALQKHLPHLLWSSLYGPYLNEGKDDDAFETLMKVLASRIPNGYKPSEETVRRFSHPGTLFPCRPDSPDWPGEKQVKNNKKQHHRSHEQH